MRTISLFSGVGMLDIGFSLACEHLGLGHRVLCYVEREAYAAACLLGRMEEASLEPAPVWCGDVGQLSMDSVRRILCSTPAGTAVGASGAVVDAITAGFPCQPFSLAGNRQGTRDARWLWDDIAGLILEVRPALVALENVPGLLVERRAFGRIASDLATLGFDAEWLCVPAAAVGASHKRERWFCLAYEQGVGQQVMRSSKSSTGQPGSRWTQSDGCCEAMGDSDESRQQERRDGRRSADSQQPASVRAGSLADAAGTNGRERVARRGSSGREAAGGAGDALGDSAGLNGRQRGRQRQQEAATAGAESGAQDASEPVADASRIPSGQRTGRQRVQQAGPPTVFAPGPGADWSGIVEQWPHLAPATEPGVRVLADGMALVLDESRADQLRCTGNGVVAIQAAVAFVELFRRAGIA